MYYNISEVFIMKRPRINLILGKKHLVAAGLALVLAVGLYANFAIGSSADGKNVSGDNYGDTRLVSNENQKRRQIPTRTATLSQPPLRATSEVTVRPTARNTLQKPVLISRRAEKKQRKH